MESRDLVRSLKNAIIGGVCAGLARDLDVDVFLLRLIAILLTMATGGIYILIYLCMWWMIPADLEAG